MRLSLAHLVGGEGVEAGRRLVQEQDPRGGHQRQPDVRPLRLAPCGADFYVSVLCWTAACTLYIATYSLRRRRIRHQMRCCCLVWHNEYSIACSCAYGG